MKRRSTILFTCSALLVVVLFVADILIGSVALPLGEVVDALFGGGDEVTRNIVLNFRLPKAVTALLVGASLSAVGLQMQTLFRNPMAGPYVLGVSSGATLGVALFLLGMPLLGISLGNSAVSSLGVVGAAWIGSALIMSVVLAVTARIKDIMVVLILGMMFGSAATAVVEILQYLSPEGALKSFVVWTMGSLGSVSREQLLIMAPVMIVGLVLSVSLIKPLNAMLLGENYASTMGINIRRTRLLISTITVMLAGTVTAFCGPIGFIGLAVPHIARMIFREADHRIMMPASMLLGSLIMLFCDVASQLPASDMTLPINTVTALIGIPVVVVVIVRNHKSFS
ncbi:MAG: iron ABC transporter permease [Tidjanibacter sp.]|nr:iron ABC transporter permease [Tidjanibacter sp.]